MSIPPQFYDVKDKLFYGSLLAFIGRFIPYIGGAISLIGAIFFIIGVYQFRVYNYRVWDIYKKLLITSILFALFIVISVVGYINGYTMLVVIFGVLTIVSLIGNIYYKIEYLRTFYHITKIIEFDKAREFYIIGLATAIILIGFILLIVSQVFEIIAYSKLPGELFKNKKEKENDSQLQVY